MAVTRDPNYPAEMAQLMQAFNVAADGHDANTVLNATLQMLIASVGFVAKQRGVSLNGALKYAEGEITTLILAGIRENWNREPSASDVQVKLS